MLFYEWYAPQSRGKLDEHSTTGTLEWKVGRFACMYEQEFGYKISQDIIDEVREVSKPVSGYSNIYLWLIVIPHRTRRGVKSQNPLIPKGVCRLDRR